MENSISQYDQICAAIKKVRSLCGEAMIEPLIMQSNFKVVEDLNFWATVQLKKDTPYLQISTGVFDRTQSLWDNLLNRNGDEILSTNSKEELIQGSLIWLLLHELSHFTLSHFEFTGKLSISETAKRSELSLISRAPNTTSKISNFEHLDYIQIERCLELQADHDAIELMLDSYSRDCWTELRTKIASIATVMVLIEKADEENAIEHSTHPKAATRIFQLLGHVTEMWSLPAHAKAKTRGETAICEADLPTQEEKQAFSKEVILPAVWDAVALAEVTKAKSIISDLGSLENFFADIGRAKLGQWDELVTVGAKEWAELKDINKTVLDTLYHSAL